MNSGAFGETSEEDSGQSFSTVAHWRNCEGGGGGGAAI